MFLNYDIIYITACYLCGSIPFGLIISKALNKKDPRLSGSKNIGATNILRLSGFRLGLITLIFDVAKAFIPIKTFSSLNLLSFDMAIISVFLGHLFPVWIKFKGGKGIAVLIGSILAYNLNFAILFLFVWIIVAIATKYSSLSALIASLTTFILILISNDELKYSMFIIFILVVFKHSRNIKRLIYGQETKIILKKVK